MKTIDDVMNFKIYLQSSSKAMADRQNKSEEQKYKNLQNEKSFLDEIKSIFHSFSRAIIWWKNKNLMKTAIFVNTSGNKFVFIELSKKRWTFFY